jgi:hypothetical protein
MKLYKNVKISIDSKKKSNETTKKLIMEFVRRYRIDEVRT